MPLSVPSLITDVTPAWLSAALAKTHHENPVHSLQATRIGESSGLSSKIYRVQLDGTELPGSVVLKLWSTQGPAGIREVLFFQEFGSMAVPHVPVCYLAALDVGASRGVLILEDLRDPVQGDCIDPIPLPRAKALAESLAALHSMWWEHPAVLNASWLPRAPHADRDVDWYATRRRLFLNRFSDRLSDQARRLLDHIQSVLGRALARLEAGGTTLVHADLHLDNVMFEAPADRPIFLDWARVARGPGSLDLASVIFGLAQPGSADVIVGAYLAALGRLGVSDLPDQDFAACLGASMLMKFSEATCGVARWQPASKREEAMIDAGLLRASSMVAEWRTRDPELFEV